MKNKIWMSPAVLVVLLSLSWVASSQEQKSSVTFFITSVGSGKGADLGGLAGADKHCQALAQAVGAGNTWHAYLSTSAADGKPAVNASGDKPNMHDILTGSQPDGRAFSGSEDMTCRNWTSSTTGTAMLGHHNRQGLRDDESSRSWNSSHPSRGTGTSGGCSQEGLRSSGGNGLFYCFAVN